MHHPRPAVCRLPPGLRRDVVEDMVLIFPVEEVGGGRLVAGDAARRQGPQRATVRSGFGKSKGLSGRASTWLKIWCSRRSPGPASGPRRRSRRAACAACAGRSATRRAAECASQGVIPRAILSSVSLWMWSRKSWSRSSSMRRRRLMIGLPARQAGECGRWLAPVCPTSRFPPPVVSAPWPSTCKTWRGDYFPTCLRQPKSSLA